MLQHLLVSLAVFVKDIDGQGFHFWMQVRTEVGPFFGLLEFPGGKIEEGETPRQAMVREVSEEVGLNLPDKLSVHFFGIQSHVASPHKTIHLYTHLVRLDAPELKAIEGKGMWFFLKYSDLQDGHLGTLTGKTLPANLKLLQDIGKFLKDTFEKNCLELLWTPSSQ